MFGQPVGGRHMELSQFYLMSIGMSTAAACVQHSFTASQNRNAWAWRAGMVVLLTLVGSACLRTMDPSYTEYPSPLGYGGLLYVRLWLDGLAYFTTYVFLVALFGIIIAYKLSGNFLSDQVQTEKQP